MTTHPSYQLRLDANRQVTVPLRTDEPLYRIVERLVTEHGLPAVDRRGQRIPYALYAKQFRRLSNQMTLKQAGYDQGGDLYLADSSAPWWEKTPAVTKRFDDDQRAAKPSRRMMYVLIGVGAAGVLVIIGAVVWLFATLVQPTVVSVQSSRESQRQRQTAQPPTTTLAPLVQVSPTEPPPTATLAPPSALQPSIPTATLAPVSPLLFPTATLALPGAATQPPLADAGVEVTVAGVKAEYLNRNDRLFFRGRTSFGAYLWSDPDLQTKVPASTGNVVVSNGDRVAILDQNEGIAQVRVITNALDSDDPKVIGATGYLPSWLITDQDVPPPPTPAPDTGKLWVRKLNEDDQPGCISMRITGVNTQGWSFSVDGMNLVGRFDKAGNARLCGLGADQEVTISVRDRRGMIVPGGRGVPSKGRAIMIGTWQKN